MPAAGLALESGLSATFLLFEHILPSWWQGQIVNGITGEMDLNAGSWSHKMLHFMSKQDHLLTHPAVPGGSEQCW